MSAAIVFAALTWMLCNKNWEKQPVGYGLTVWIMRYVMFAGWFFSLTMALCGGGE